MEKNSFVIQETNKYVAQYGEVPPPWIFRPNSHPYSGGWRQGAGETFYMIYAHWFEEHYKTEEEKINYFKKYSPPPRWLVAVIEDIWEPEGWDEPEHVYPPYLKKLQELGFEGTDDYQRDLDDEKWLDYE